MKENTNAGKCKLPWWVIFIQKQEDVIQKRIAKYTNKKTLQKDLIETGCPSPYQTYKSREVVPPLRQALRKIMMGTYGDCDVCGSEIPIERLEIVPGALACVQCDAKRI